MLPTLFSSAFGLWLPVVFGLSVAVRHAGPGVLHHFGEGWTFASCIDGVTRLVQLSIAVLLPLPQARFWNGLLEHARSISVRDFLTLVAITIMPPKLDVSFKEIAGAHRRGVKAMTAAATARGFTNANLCEGHSP